MTRFRRPAAVAAAAAVAVAAATASGHAPIGVLLQGAIFGSATGLLAIGLVLTYRSTRVVNFAYGAMGGLPASVGVALFLGRRWPWPLVVALTVVLGALLGFAVERVVIRRFANTARLTLTVATIGLAQLLGGLEILVPQYVGGAVIIPSFSTPFNRLHVLVGPVVFTGNDLLLALTVPVVVVGLTWFLMRTDSGTAVRAAAENRDRARLLGIPVNRHSALVWSLGGALAAGVIVLRAPGTGLTNDAAAGPALLLPALAAAVIARMESLPKAFVSGLVLGVLDQAVRWNVSTQSVTTVVFLAVILAALLVQGQRAAPLDGVEESSWTGAAVIRPVASSVARLPEIRAARGALLGGILLLSALVAVMASPSLLDRISVALLFGMVALSLVVLTGWGGTVSLGQFALAGIGGLIVANLVGRWNVDLFAALAAAGAAGGLTALLLGLPALRVRGQFLAVTTLAFAVMVDFWLLNPANFRRLIPDAFERPVLWKRFDLASERAMYLLVLGVLLLTIVLVRGLQAGRTGRVLRATRDNPRAASAAGASTTRARLMAFVIAGVIAGVAGGLNATVLGAVGLHTYDSSQSLLVFSMAVIGGVSSIGGALCGVAIIFVAGQLLPQYQLIIAGTGLLGVLMFVPGGIAATVTEVRDRLFAIVAARRGPVGRRHTSLPRPRIEAASVAASTVGPRTGDGDDVMLSCRRLDASYGTMQVLFGVDFEVRRGELVALLGTNGAGKSTLLRTVSNLLHASRGEVLFEGTRLNGTAPEAIARAGLGLMPGGRGIFPTLSVAEHLRLATWLLRRDPCDSADARGHVLDLFPVLRERLDLAAGRLSGGEQQMLSLAMALAARPRLLCIDEVSLGLAPAAVTALMETIRGIHAAGTTVVVVDQSVSVALLLAQRAAFMERGTVRFDGPTAELLQRPDLVRSVFLGGDRAQYIDAVPAQAASGDTRTPVLACSGLSKRLGGITAVDAVDVSVDAGRVVGLIGHNGAGKTTLLDLLSGFLPPDCGSVRFRGVDVTRLAPQRRAMLGLGRSFQEARLYPTLTVAEALSMGLERHLFSREPVASAFRLPASLDTEAAALERVEELVELLGLGVYRDQLCGELSTGVRRIVELGCVLAQEPALVLLDEPSAGIAHAETEALAELLRDVRRRTGCAMLVVEHDIPLLRDLCDELIAMERGAVIARGAPRTVLDDPRVIASYLGSESPSGVSADSDLSLLRHGGRPAALART